MTICDNDEQAEIVLAYHIMDNGERKTKMGRRNQHLRQS